MSTAPNYFLVTCVSGNPRSHSVNLRDNHELLSVLEWTKANKVAANQLYCLYYN